MKSKTKPLNLWIWDSSLVASSLLELNVLFHLTISGEILGGFVSICCGGTKFLVLSVLESINIMQTTYNCGLTLYK